MLWSVAIVLALCLVLGWAMVGICRIYAANLSNIALLLLFGGGIAYSAGAVVHAQVVCLFITLHGTRWFWLMAACIGQPSQSRLRTGAA